MKKINQEEYEILKKIDDKWKWIARDKFASQFPDIYQTEPLKGNEIWFARHAGDYETIENGKLFQFVQWEDEDPYNISELIEEYENSAEHVSHVVNERVKALGKAWSESEEEEMKKGIEWLKDILFDENVIRLFPNDIEKLHELINQLDEPEVLSQEWLDENKSSWTKLKIDGYYIPVEKLQNLLVPKQNRQKDWAEFTEFLAHERIFSHEDKEYIIIEKPVIPQFVADFIKDKEEWALFELFDENYLYDYHPEIAKWLYDNDDETNRKRELLMVGAKVRGYEIEPEPQYRLKAGENYLYFNLDGTVRGSTKKNAVITKERLEKLPFDVEMAVLSGIIEVEELEE